MTACARTAASLCVLLGLPSGCAAPQDEPLPSAPGPLIEVAAWRLLDLEDDPMPEHQPPTIACPEIGWAVEGGSLEVDTGECNYLSVQQVLLHDVATGAPVTVELWHQTLHAELPAVGHAALFIDDVLVWEREVDIPGPPAIWTDEAPAPTDFSAGDSVVFHLHNHGINTWNLGEVNAGEPAR